MCLICTEKPIFYFGYYSHAKTDGHKQAQPVNYSDTTSS